MMFARKEIAKVLGAAMAVAPLILSTPGSAAADATDDAFSHELFAAAVNFAPQQFVIKKARIVCDSFDAGMPAAEVHKTLLEGSTSVEGSAFSPRQAAVFMTKAVQSYCPGYVGLFAR